MLRAIPAAVAAAAMAVAAVPVVGSLEASALRWWWTKEQLWSRADPFFGPHLPLAWSIGGLLLAALLAWLFVRRSDRRVTRSIVGLWGLGQVAFASLAVLGWTHDRRWDPGSVSFPTADVAGFAIAAVAAVAVAAGLVSTGERRQAIAAAVLAVTMTSMVHARSIVRSVADAWPQDLPAFELRLVEALPVYEVDLDPMALMDPTTCRSIVDVDGRRICVSDGAPCGTLVDADGRLFCLRNESDALVFTSEAVRRVRWEDEDVGAFTLVFGRRAASAVRARSLRRIREHGSGDYAHDALFVDGEIAMVPHYADVILQGAMTLRAGSIEGTRTRDLYRTLTGLEAPRPSPRGR